MATITSLDQLDLNKRYTYADYVKWRFRERVELLKGWILPLAAPNLKHQEISTNLVGLMFPILRQQGCKLFAAPFDVRLPQPHSKLDDDKIDTVVQPDICVVCDMSKLEKRGCVGPPELIVEILSPGNSKKEMRRKYELYEGAGVTEYWIVDPDRHSVLAYVLKDGRFVNSMRPQTDEDVLRSSVFPALEIDLSEVFPEDGQEP